MKELMLLNPVKRRRRRRTSSPRRRRRHIRRNPVSRRRRTRRRSYRRHRRNPVSAVMNPRRRGRRRHRYRRNPVFGAGGPMGVVKDLVSADTLTIAGGAVLSGLVTSWLMSRFGPYMIQNGAVVPNTGFKLPGSDTQYGPMLYSVAIPVGASVLTHRFSPKLSQGLMIGGAVLLIQNVLNLVQGATGSTIVSQGTATGAAAATQGAGAYLRRGTIRALPGSPPGYSAVRAFGGALDNSNAFKGAWSR